MTILQTSGFDTNVIINDAIGPAAAPGAYFGFARTNPAVNSTGPRIYAVSTNPNGVLIAPAGSLALQTDGTLWRNTDGVTNWASGGGGTGGTVIQSEVLAAPAAAFPAFAAIPQTFTHLLMYFSTRVDVATPVQATFMTVNGDNVAANYIDQELGVVDGVVGGVAETNLPRAGIATGTTAPAGSFGNGTIFLPWYSRTDIFKPFRTESDAYAPNVGGSQWLYWHSTTRNVAGVGALTDAITDILFASGGGNFDTGSRATLVGITT